MRWMLLMKSTAKFRYLLLAGLFMAAPAFAQISFTSAVDLALGNSPRVRLAQSDVSKAQAVLAESKDAYVPSLAAATDLGYSFGFPLGQPTLFNITAQSLIFNFSQRDYLRSARSGLDAANLALMEARQQVEADAAITYISLNWDERRSAVMAQQYGFATHLRDIVEQRLNAGQDTEIELSQSHLTVDQIHLQQVLLVSEIANDREHLARLTGQPESILTTIPNTIPPIAAPASSNAPASVIPGVRAAFATARAKQFQAFGDSRFSWRPQIGFGAEYSRFSTFNNYALYYPGFNGNYNAVAIAVQIQIPLYDPARTDRGRASAADAAHARTQAEIDRSDFLEGRFKLQQATTVLAARVEVAIDEQQLSLLQLDAILVQLQGSGSSEGPQLTPKDEQKARIDQCQKTLDLLKAEFTLAQTQINLLRQNGELEPWLKSGTGTPPASVPQAPTPQTLTTRP